MIDLALLLALLAAVVVGTRGEARMVFLAILGSLIANAIDRGAPRIASGLIRGAVRLLPEPDRRSQLEEWEDHLASAGVTGLRPLGIALSLVFVATPLLVLRAVRLAIADYFSYASSRSHAVLIDPIVSVRVDVVRRLGPARAGFSALVVVQPDGSFDVDCCELHPRRPRAWRLPVLAARDLERHLARELRHVRREFSHTDVLTDGVVAEVVDTAAGEIRELRTVARPGLEPASH